MTAYVLWKGRGESEGERSNAACDVAW